MTQRRKLLFLSHTLPFPPDGGVKIRTFNILKQLAGYFDITALCFYRRRLTPDVAVATRALNQVCHTEPFATPQEHSRIRLALDHLRSVTQHRVYTVFCYESAEYAARLTEMLQAGGFHLAHADSLDLSRYFPAITGLPLACTHHNVESMLLRRRAALEPGTVRRAYISWQARLMEREERRWVPNVAVNVTVSPADKKHLAELVPHARFIVAPNGVDVDEFQPQPGREEGLLFVGGASWFPNLDAMQHFCRDILPHLRAQGVRTPVHWVGRVPRPLQLSMEADYGIHVAGYVPDVRPAIRDSACCIVPIRVGGGTRLKILDAWAMGKAVVSTSVGCEGLHALDGQNILIRDEPESFAAALKTVLTDGALRRALGARARETILQHYDWRVIGRALVHEYQMLGNTSRAATASS